MNISSPSNLSVTSGNNPSRLVTSSQGSHEDRQQRETLADKVSSREQTEKELQANQYERQREAARQEALRAERRLQGRMVMDARQERAREADGAEQARAMRQKVEETYQNNQERRAQEIHKQSENSNQQNQAINLVV